ncbi:hypothetical protein EV682_1077 [Iodobacter fluviatilis]|uniref:Uncharacterized protein n=1 Tax=Iodobacter fluviatilis TaxID=537 RepID=A0A377SUK4_9NEIS|nr:hypothetical protein EV682_1077 [Iodobacter fluviatilis]STR45055.1 Uncharacterised protein [Iodobacter fluviatilis]
MKCDEKRRVAPHRRANQSQKDQCLRHVDLGAGVPLDLPFLRGQETKPSHKLKARNPLLRSNQVGGGRDWLAASLPSDPPPRLFGACVFQGDF